MQKTWNGREEEFARVFVALSNALVAKQMLAS